MIKPVTMYSCYCDVCGRQWGDDGDGIIAYESVGSMETMVDESGWEFEDGKHLCPNCWEWSEDGGKNSSQTNKNDMSNTETKYKKMEDHVYIESVPSYYTGSENPKATISVSSDMDEFKRNALKVEIAAALIRWGAITKHHFKAEIKP